MKKLVLLSLRAKMCVVATEMLQYNTDHLVTAKEVYSQISTDLLTILDKIGTNLPFTLLYNQGHPTNIFLKMSR